MTSPSPKRLAEMLANPGDKSHGTMRGYELGCRCEECRRENTRYQLDYRYRTATAAPLEDYHDDPRHGTTNGYTNLMCRCDRCRAAWASAVRERAEKRAARPIPDRVHGTTNGYGNYGCRCDRCTTAHRQDDRARRLRRKEAKK